MRKFLLIIFIFTYSYTFGQGVQSIVLAPCNTPPAITCTTNIGIGSTATATNTMSGGTWASSNTAVGTIGSISGVVGGISGGTINISYTVCANAPPAVNTVTVNSAALVGYDSSNKASNITLNTTVQYQSAASANGFVRSVNSHIIHVSGLSYAYEVTISSGGSSLNESPGVVLSTVTNYAQEPASVVQVGGVNVSYVMYGGDGNVYKSGAGIQTSGLAYGNGDVIGVVFNTNSVRPSIKWYKNGTLAATVTAALSSGQTWYMMSGYASGVTAGNGLTNAVFKVASMTYGTSYGIVSDW